MINTSNFSNLGEFENLPPELLIKILSNLPPDELSRVAVFSKGFKNISNDLALWKPIGEKFHITNIDKSNPKLQVTAEIVQRKLNGKLFKDLCSGNFFMLEKALKDNPNLLSLVDLKGNTLAHHIVDIGRYQGGKAAGTAIKFLKEHDADMMIKNFHGRTPLDELFAGAQFPTIHDTTIPMVIDWLVEKQFDFDNLKNTQGQTFLHLLARYTRHDPNVGEQPENVDQFFNLIREKGIPIDVNVQDNFGLTPLAHAIIGMNRLIAEKLITEGATYDFIENADIYAWNKAELSEVGPNEEVPSNEIVELEKEVANVIDFDPEVVEDFISNLHSSLNTLSLDGEDQFNSMLNTLIEKIKPEHINTQDMDGNTLAHIAALTDNVKGLELLHKKGANFELLKDGLTPIYLSIINNRENSFFTLIEHGAQIPDKIGDNNNLTLTLCFNCKNVKIIDYCFKNQSFTIPEDMEEDFIQNGIFAEDTAIEEKMMRLADRGGNPVMVLFLMKKGLRPQIPAPQQLPE
jgi:ankyrin repeat protein